MSHRRSLPLSPSARRAPCQVRWTARAATVSVLLAFGALCVTGVAPAGLLTAVLKLVFIASSASAMAAIALWGVACGLHAAFAPRDSASMVPISNL